MNLKKHTTIRTNNFNDPKIVDKIKSLWEQTAPQVEQPFQMNQAVFIVYHNYHSDYTGDYSVSLCTIAAENHDFDTSLLQWKTYPVTAIDQMAVLNTWKEIWQEEENKLLHRSYSFDYEEYQPCGAISIHVSL